MKVILLQNVEDVGKRFEVREVAAGHARNFLFPRKLAVPASPEALQWLETQKGIMEQQAEEELKKAQELASHLDDLEVPMIAKIGEEGQLFEQITAQKVADHLKELGFDVKKNQVKLEEPIKEIGEYPVKVVLDHNLEATIQVIITEEESQ